MKKNGKARPAREPPAAKGGPMKVSASAEMAGKGKNSVMLLTNSSGFDGFCLEGDTRLSECPEIVTAVNARAKLVGSMTLHLMENTERGDVRIHSALSDLVDIRPNRYMTRSSLFGPFPQDRVRAAPGADPGPGGLCVLCASRALGLQHFHQRPRV